MLQFFINSKQLSLEIGVPAMQNRQAKYGYLFMLPVIVAVIAAAGYGFVQQQNQIAIEEARLDLANIVDLKVSQIVQWRRERLLEAASIYSNTMISHRIKEYLAGREKAAAFKEVRDWMTTLQNAAGYSNMILFRPNGEVLTSASSISWPLAGDRERIKAAVRKKEVVLSDLYIHDDTGKFDIHLVIPIMDPEDKSGCLAVISININPMIHLYPLFRKWPTPSRTGENLLFRYDGNDVLFLNELRFRDKSALALRQPPTRNNTAAARAALGQEGVFEGRDHRGVDVIAAVRAVPDSPWAIVSKVDTLEVLEPVTERIWYVVGTCILVVLATGMALSLWWRRKQEAYLRKQYETELEFNRELKQAEQSLQDANNRLEERVATRTAELSNSNTQLRQEITERKQVEELLRKHFHIILQSPFAIIIADLGGTIEFVNPKFTEYSGYTYEEAIGQNISFLKTEETSPEVHQQIWETVTAGNTWQGELCNRRKNGELYWQYAKILPFKDHDGRITNYMAFKEDITRNKQLEDKLFQSRKLETIGQIAGGVAHEVRNPLNAILSITEALFREDKIEGNPEFAPYIQHIRTQVNRLADLMNDLLDLGKPISAGNLQVLPLLELCRETMDLWQISGMAENRQGVITTGQDAADTLVTADSSRFQQAIFNLLENAGHHSSAENTIVMRLAVSTSSRGMAIVQITDSGGGIPEESLSRVFEPFYSNRRGGTGLGLSLVKHFIESMGGSVRIWNNDPPPGCTAELCIPLAVKEQT